jgi:hypothetical protein
LVFISPVWVYFIKKNLATLESGSVFKHFIQMVKGFLTILTSEVSFFKNSNIKKSIKTIWLTTVASLRAAPVHTDDSVIWDRRYDFLNIFAKKFGE